MAKYSLTFVSARPRCDMEFFTALSISAYLPKHVAQSSVTTPPYRIAVHPNATHVWSNPSGRKTGSHPKSAGPRGSTIVPYVWQRCLSSCYTPRARHDLHLCDRRITGARRLGRLRTQRCTARTLTCPHMPLTDYSSLPTGAAQR